MHPIAKKLITQTPEIQAQAIEDIQNAYKLIPKKQREIFWMEIIRGPHVKAHNGFFQHIHRCILSVPKVSKQNVKNKLLTQYNAIEVFIDKEFLLGVDQVDDFIKLISKYHVS